MYNAQLNPEKEGKREVNKEKVQQIENSYKHGRQLSNDIKQFKCE